MSSLLYSSDEDLTINSKSTVLNESSPNSSWYPGKILLNKVSTPAIASKSSIDSCAAVTVDNAAVILDLKQQVSDLKADIKSHESKIVSLEARVDNLKKELKYYKSLSASHHSFSELEVTSNSDVDSTNFKKEHNSGRRENIYEKQLKAYGFSSRISITDFVCDSISQDDISSYQPELTPIATRQLNDLLNISESPLVSSSTISNRMTPTNPTVSVLSRLPSGRFDDPLTALALAYSLESMNDEIQQHQLRFQQQDTSFQGLIQSKVTDVKKSSSTTNLTATVDGSKRKVRSISFVSSDEMPYTEFVQRMLLSECDDLVNKIRNFLLSVLGPNGDAMPPSRYTKVDYVFHGTKQLERRCRDFFDSMQLSFRDHACWKDESEERIIASRDCLEHYVMTRIFSLAYNIVENKRDDDMIMRRMRILSFLKPENLDIRPELRDEKLWISAINELRKINDCLTPGDKITCVVSSASSIFQTLEEVNLSGSDEMAFGADDFFPLFIVVVLRSQTPCLYTNCSYIQAFLNPIQLMSKSGYFLVNLQSALEFIMTLDQHSISNMSPKLFKQNLEDAEKALDLTLLG